MLPSFDFMPLEKILNVSLNGFRKQVATHHKTLIGTQIDKTSILLESWHKIVVEPSLPFVSIS